jgi:PqqD family protein of HPr-rel-A system
VAGPCYIADEPGAVTIVALDGLVALFHAHSGMTHILAPPAPQILEALEAGAADAGEILARIAADYEIGDGDLSSIGARLDELEAAGLVRRQ